jgi:hypothetical protein
MTADQQKRMEEIMRKLGDVHVMMARTRLPPLEYHPISSLMTEAKVELFDLYNDLRWYTWENIGQPLKQQDK